MSFEGNININIKSKFKYEEDADIFPSRSNIFLCSFVNNRYPAIYTPKQQTDNEQLIRAQDIIKEKYNIPFKYKSISGTFALFYSFLYKAIKHNYHKYKKIAIFDNTIGNLESLLYFINIYITKAHIDYNYLYLIEKEDGFPEFEKLKMKLAKYYDQALYKILIDKNQTCDGKSLEKQYDFVMFNYKIFGKNKQFIEREIVHFSNLITMFKILVKGGDYLFNMRHFSQTYMKQIVYLLLKYFKKVSFIESKMYSTNVFVKCEDYINPINDADYNILVDLLEQWQKLNPKCSDNLNFVKKELRNKYGITEAFNKNQSNKIVTQLFDFVYPKDYNTNFDSFFDKHNKKFEKMIICDKITEKSIADLDAQQLVEYYDKNYKNNYGRLMEFSKEYKLPLKQEVITSAKKYQQQILRETISLVSSTEMTLVDYNKDKKITNISSFKYKDYDFSFDKLLKNKYELNLHKISIDSRELKYWGEVTEKINIPRFIVAYIKKTYNLNITRAFIKMFELLNEYELIDLKKDNIKVFHTCEAPGHFINATNYYIKLHNNKAKYDWYANSLNPHNSENKRKYGHDIFGDSYGFMKRYRDRWLWGKDDTGDITNVENVKYYQQKFNYSADLFTSDCGLGSTTKSDFFDQEKRLSILNFAQCLIALLTLKIGGNAVFKVFVPLSESITVSILFLLMKYFKKVHFIKQSAGSPGSSEIYIVALNKTKHLEDDLITYLLDCLKNFDPNKSLFPKELLDKKFIDQIENIGHKFVEDQINTLNRSTFYYDWPQTLKDHEEYIENGKKAYVDQWLENNKFKTLDKQYML